MPGTGLNGTIPAKVSNLPFDSAFNSGFAFQIGTLQYLSEVDLSHNMITSGLAQLSSLPLTHLDLGHNRLCGADNLLASLTT